MIFTELAVLLFRLWTGWTTWTTWTGWTPDWWRTDRLKNGLSSHLPSSYLDNVHRVHAVHVVHVVHGSPGTGSSSRHPVFRDEAGKMTINQACYIMRIDFNFP
ncbi:MAG: hypothetical protein ABIJ42_11715 [Acidobacteriota bacterium]